MVLPAFEELLSHFEDQRRSMVSWDSATRDIPSSAATDEVPPSQQHFATAVNLGWQKLDEYYGLLDDSVVYVAAVLLHPRLKWLWFEKHWSCHQDWIVAARKAIKEFWHTYKDKAVGRGTCRG